MSLQRYAEQAEKEAAAKAEETHRQVMGNVHEFQYMHADLDYAQTRSESDRFNTAALMLGQLKRMIATCDEHDAITPWEYREQLREVGMRCYLLFGMPPKLAAHLATQKVWGELPQQANERSASTDGGA